MSLRALELRTFAIKQGFKQDSELIHIFSGGSNLHGATDDTGKGDLDLCGLFIEPPPYVLGIDRDEHFISKTAAEGERNGKDDKDFTMYSLRKWAALACKGNPNAPLFLYAPSTPGMPATVWDEIIVPNADAFIAKTTLIGNVAKRGGLLGFAYNIWKRAEAQIQGKTYSESGGFLGFSRNMLHRMQGKRGRGKKGQRPELEKKFGYDSKAAMHMLRTVYEAIELVETGKLTFPNPHVDELKAVRRGDWKKEDIEGRFEELEAYLKEIVHRSKMPMEIDRERVSGIISSAYLQHWKGRGIL